MFGYIFPEKNELKIKDYDLFKGYYCGVCMSIKNRYKLLNRMTLTYDAAFLAIFLDSLNDNKIIAKRKNCISHPIKKRPMVERNRYSDYGADMNVLLTYYNIKDDWKDEKSIPKFIFSLLLRKSLKNVKKLYPHKCAIIEENLNKIYELEKNKCDKPEEIADPFGKLMEEIIYEKEFAIGEEESFRKIGYNIGKWIYLIDAYDDIEEDIKKGKYNPLIIKYKLTKDNYKEKIDEIVRKDMDFVLIYTLSEISNEYRTIDIKKNEGILDNIFYMGMLRKTESILKIGSSEKN